MKMKIALLTICLALSQATLANNVKQMDTNIHKAFPDTTYVVSRGGDISEIREQQVEQIKEGPKQEVEQKTYTWNGSKLTASKGVNYGPTGKETYYNLPMDGVIKIMGKYGYTKDDYWVREDGCKMLGNYIMVAANLNMFPRGSTVETSLGTGLVCDTGGFAKDNPTQLDIAVNW